MRIVCPQKILLKYHALVVILEKQQNLKLWSAENCRWHFIVRGDRDSRANLMPIYGDLYQIKL